MKTNSRHFKGLLSLCGLLLAITGGLILTKRIFSTNDAVRSPPSADLQQPAAKIAAVFPQPQTSKTQPLKPTGPAETTSPTKGASGSGPSAIPKASLLKEFFFHKRLNRQVPVVKGEVMVRFKPGLAQAEIDQTLRELGAAVLQRKEALGVYRLRLPDAKTVADFVQEHSKNGNLALMEPNFTTSVMAESPVTPNDPSLPEQWALNIIQAPKAWQITTGEPEVVVAILDTGIELSHEDLKNKVVPGYDFVNGSDDPSDDHGHGTHVAGIVAAEGNNGQGIAGVAWGSRLMPVKVINAAGEGTYSDVVDGILFAADHGATILNFSIGGYAWSQILDDAVEYAHGKGAVLVAAAGNDGSSDPVYPAACPNVIGVAATDPSDQIWPYSNHGTHVRLCAPGTRILSTTLGDGYGSETGTSASAAHAAGVAALVFSRSRILSNTQVEQMLYETADDLGDSGYDPVFGFGRLNAASALAKAGTDVHDMAVTRIRVQPPRFKVGQPVILVVTVQNQGTFVESNLSVRLSVNSTNLCGLVTTGRMNPGQIQEVQFVWTPSTETSGAVEIIAQVDAATDEVQLDDNTKRCKFTLLLDGHGMAVLYANSPPVHSWVAYQAFLLWPGTANTEFSSNLHPYTSDSDLLSRLFGREEIYATWGVDSATGSTLLEGTYEEDTSSSSVGHINGASSVDHFWNPDSTYDDGIFWGALTDSALEKGNVLWGLATNAYPANKALAYYYLGRLAHLLADMSVPAHVHLDPHLGDNLHILGITIDTTDDSTYEGFTAQNKQYQLCAGCTSAGRSLPNINSLPLNSIPAAVGVPSDYDLNVAKLFYNLAQQAQYFDSDGAGYDGNNTRGSAAFGLTPKQGVTRRTYSLEVNGGARFDSGSASVVWRNWTILGFEDHPLNVNVDYWESPWRGRVLLADNIGEAANNTLDEFVVSYGVNGVPRPVETVFDLYELGDILDSETLAAQNVLEARAIEYTAALFKYFWDTTHAGADSEAPSAAITSPTGGTVSGNFTVSGSASDNVGVTRVEFLVDGTLRFTDSSSPYSWSWNTALYADGSHTLVIKAYDAAGNVGTSPSVTVTVNNGGDTTPPVISSVRVSTMPNSATVTWTTSEPANGQIEYGTSPCPCGSSTPLAPSMTTAHSITLSSLAASTTYYYRIFSRDAAGNLAHSANLSFQTTTTPNTAPSVALGTPNGGETWAVGSVHNITWSAVDDVGVNSVALWYSTDAGVNWMLIASGLGNSGSYAWTVPNSPTSLGRVWVYAQDGAGALGADSSDANFTIAASCPVPATPVLQNISVPPSGNYTVAWNSVSDANYYVLEESATPGFAQVSPYNTTDLSRFIVGVPGTRYYRVRAVNNCGQSANSGTQTASVVVDQGPGPISVVSPADNATSQPLSVNLCWSCTHPGGESLRYNVYVVPSDTDIFCSPNIRSAGQSATCFSVANLPWNTRVSWGIEAIDETGQRQFSQMFHFTTIVDTNAPTGGISINNGAATTDTYAVTLNLSAADEASGVEWMRLSNDGTNWTFWLRFVSQVSWNLADYNYGGCPGRTDYTAFAQFMDAQNNASPVCSATITKAVGTPGIVVLRGKLYPTIREAVAAAAPGDTVYLSEGSFTVNGTVDMTRTHEPGYEIGIVMRPGVTLMGAGANKTTIIFDNSYYGLVDANDATIKGIKLVNGSTYPGRTTVLVESIQSSIQDCIISGGYHGLYIGHSAAHAATNCTVENTVVANNHDGVWIITAASNIAVLNCTLAYNFLSAGLFVGSASSTIENNIISSNGVNVSAPIGVMPTFKYNDVFPATGETGYQNMPSQTGINGNLAVDPQFVNSASQEFHLLGSSPAINAGTYVGIPFAGLAPDMGAFEYSGTGTIRVSSNRTNAAFIVTGPQGTYSGSGTNWTLSSVPIGVYSVTFSPLTNLYTPTFEAQTLQCGQTVIFNGTYQPDTIAPTGTLTVNYDEYATADSTVVLALDFSDEIAGMGAGAQMMFSNDGTNWSAPEPYSTVKRDWSLFSFGGSETSGVKVVYARVADAFGNWGTFTNTVLYVPNRRTLEVSGDYLAIQAAIDSASPGDIVHVAPGHYCAILDVKPGVTLQGSGPANSLFVDVSYMMHVQPNATVEGFGGYWQMSVSSGAAIIQNNRFEGYSRVYASGTTRAVVRNNVFGGANNVALNVNGYSGQVVVQAENNTFAGNNISLSVVSDRPSVRVYSRNNIFAFNRIAVADYITTDVEHQHIFSEFNTYWSNTNGNFSGIYQRLEAGDFIGDPIFADWTNGNCFLMTASLSVNSGKPEARYNDRDGTRNDRGAYGGPCLNTAPVADFVATPQLGSVGTFFTFDAGSSFDRETDNAKLLVRWDFDGDGNWDTDYSTLKTTTKQLTNPGSYTVVLEVRDERGWVTTTNRQIRVENQPPVVPVALSVTNGARNQPIFLTLDWAGGDLDPQDTVTYDLYFGTTDNPPLVASDSPQTSFCLPLLNYNTFYYWQVVAKDNHGGSTFGPVWNFLTQGEPAPPGLVSSGFSLDRCFEGSITSEPGRNYRIETSTNLVNWQDLISFTATNAVMPFRDTGATNFNHRFYRAVVW